MKISDLLLMCVRNLTRRKFRTFLTVTGVVIGTCAIVVMISLGVGISASFDEMLQSMGDLTIIRVYTMSNETPLTDETVKAMEMLPGVQVAAPTMRFNPNNSYMQMYSGRKDRYVCYSDVVGVRLDSLEKMGYTVKEGKLELGGGDKSIQMVIGPDVPYYVHDTKKRGMGSSISPYPDENGNIPDPFFDPMTAEYTLRVFRSKDDAKDLDFKAHVVGILNAKENDWEVTGSSYMDIADLKRIKAAYEKENGIKPDKNKPDSYDNVRVKVTDLDHMKPVQDAIKDMGFNVYSMEETRENMQKSTQQIQLILGALGGVSLFVAAISITNTMIMSVYERTREIGVMKVLGCLVGNIRSVFLLEAGIIGFLGGVLGVGLSYLLSYLMNKYGGALGSGMGMGMGMGGEGAPISIIPPWLVLLGLVFATMIGLVSGFYPANRAVKISALEAIKQE